jgi:hypothetical protein
MRTPETLFTQTALGEIPCPCDVRCIAINNFSYPPKYTDIEQDICTSVTDSKGQHIKILHKTYERYIKCIMSEVIQRIVIIVNAYYNKTMDPPVNVRSLPTGSEDLVKGRQFVLTDATRFIVDNTSPSFFKKFQFAETSEELTDMIDRNVFSICAYLVKIRKLNEKSLPL